MESRFPISSTPDVSFSRGKKESVSEGGKPFSDWMRVTTPHSRYKEREDGVYVPMDRQMEIENKGSVVLKDALVFYTHIESMGDDAGTFKKWAQMLASRIMAVIQGRRDVFKKGVYFRLASEGLSIRLALDEGVLFVHMVCEGDIQGVLADHVLELETVLEDRLSFRKVAVSVDRDVSGLGNTLDQIEKEDRV